MSDLDDDLEGMRARTGDPDTSHAAMQAYDKERMRRAAEHVIHLYTTHGPMADYELQARFEETFPRFHSRHLYQQARSIARDRGRIRDTGTRVVNPTSKRKQIVWEACNQPPPEIPRCPTCGKVIRSKKKAEQTSAS